MVFLGIGSVGYRLTENMGWLDATLNAAMILTSMGPVSGLVTPAGKVFAIVYAMLSGFVFITVAAIIMEPAVHRLLKGFRLESAEKK